jgi:hypothetical protein
MRLSTAIFVVLAALPSAAEPLVDRPVPQTDPLEYGSLRIDDADLGSGVEPGWQMTITSTYFNQWNQSWHLRQTRDDRDVRRVPVTVAEIDDVESVWAPHDDIYALDVEGTKTELALTRAFASGHTITLRVPWITIGGMSGDVVGETVHHILPQRRDRDFFERGATLVYLKMKGRPRVLHGADLDGAGVGDATVTVSARVGKRHRIGLAVQPPTGRKGTLHGSGGWDTAALWQSRWGTPRWLATASAGFSILDGAGDLLGIARENLWYVTGSYTRSLSSVTSARVVARLESSPLASYTAANVGAPSLVYTIGVTRSFGEFRLAADLGEELLPQSGVDSDYSLHVSVGRRF